MILKVRDIPNSWAIFSNVTNLKYRLNVSREEATTYLIDKLIELNENEIEEKPLHELGSVSDDLWVDSECGIDNTKCKVIEYIQDNKLKHIVTIQDCYLLNDKGQTIERI